MIGSRLRLSRSEQILMRKTSNIKCTVSTEDIKNTLLAQEDSFKCSLEPFEKPTDVTQEIALMAAMADITCGGGMLKEWALATGLDEIHKAKQMLSRLLSTKSNVADVYKHTYLINSCLVDEITLSAYAYYFILRYKIGAYWIFADKGVRVSTSDTKLSKNCGKAMMRYGPEVYVQGGLSTATIKQWALEKGFVKGGELTRKEMLELYYSVSTRLVNKDLSEEYLRAKSGVSVEAYRELIWPRGDNPYEYSYYGMKTEFENAINKLFCDALAVLCGKEVELQAALSEKDNELSKVKSRLSEKEKKVGLLKADIRALELERARLTKELSTLTNKGVVDVSPYLTQISQLEERVTRQSDSLTTSNRETVRINKLLATYVEENEELRQQLSQRDETIQRLTESAVQIRGVGAESLVTAMKDKKVVMIGGDFLHSKLQQLPFEDLRLYAAGGMAPTKNILESADALVISTVLNSHGSTSIPVSIARDKSIPILFYGGSSVEAFVIELFERLFGQGLV